MLGRLSPNVSKTKFRDELAFQLKFGMFEGSGVTAVILVALDIALPLKLPSYQVLGLTYASVEA